MASISRRTFLKRGGTGIAAAGVFAALPSFPGRALASRGPAAVHDAGVAAPAGRAATGPLVVHIPDPRRGEVHLMVGTRKSSPETRLWSRACCVRRVEPTAADRRRQPARLRRARHGNDPVQTIPLTDPVQPVR